MSALAVAPWGTSDRLRQPASADGSLPHALSRHLPLLVHTLRFSALPPTSRLGLMASYHLGWTDPSGQETASATGKFLRGCLAMWAAEQCSGDASRGLPVAAAVEWMHNFTLVHDDIQDGDRERRHRPTVWAVWGEAQAINAGDGLHAIAYQALLEGRDRPRLRLRAAAALNRAVLEVIEGQCLDLALEGRVDTTIATYGRLARAKTGALIGAAMEAAGLLGGATCRQATMLRQAGVELGVAFQIRDDWLGTWGDNALTGKGCGDLARRKISYPVVIGQSRLEGSAKREFRRLYAQPGGDESRILGLLEMAGTPSLMTEALLRHSRRAVQLLERAGLSDGAVSDFDSIVAFIVERSA